jgi:hypothetical protein
MEDCTFEDVKAARKHKREISDALGAGITIGALGMLGVFIFATILDDKKKKARKAQDELRDIRETAEAARDLAKDAEQYARDLEAREAADAALRNNN